MTSSNSGQIAGDRAQSVEDQSKKWQKWDELVFFLLSFTPSDAEIEKALDFWKTVNPLGQINVWKVGHCKSFGIRLPWCWIDKLINSWSILIRWETWDV